MKKVLIGAFVNGGIIFMEKSRLSPFVGLRLGTDVTPYSAASNTYNVKTAIDIMCGISFKIGQQKDKRKLDEKPPLNTN